METRDPAPESCHDLIVVHAKAALMRAALCGRRGTQRPKHAQSVTSNPA